MHPKSKSAAGWILLALPCCYPLEKVAAECPLSSRVTLFLEKNKIMATSSKNS